MESASRHTNSTNGTASVPAHGSSTVLVERPSATKCVTVSASRGKTAQHPMYLTMILVGVRAPTRLVNAPIQFKYSIPKPVNVSVLRSFRVTKGKSSTLPHVSVSVQSQVPIALLHMCTMITLASASAHKHHQKAVHMDRTGTLASANVNVRKH